MDRHKKIETVDENKLHTDCKTITILVHSMLKPISKLLKHLLSYKKPGRDVLGALPWPNVASG